MISYIASVDMANIIQKICKRKNILILNSQETETDLKKYVKETKINFNLIKHLIIDLSVITNSESEIIESIYNFSKLYTKTKIIILATGYEEQNAILTDLFDLGFYNIINEFESDKIETKLNMALENGLSKNDAKKFKKIQEIVPKNNKVQKVVSKLKIEKLNTKLKQIKESKSDMPDNKVYLFSLLLESVTRLVKLICYLMVFGLTSVGLTILLNGELREMVFQIFGLK